MQQKAEDADSGKDVIAIVNGNDATLKKLIKYDNGSVELRPLNPEYKSVTFTAEEVLTMPITILGFVRELRRKI